MGSCFVGTAGWSVGKPFRDRFPQEGSQLERYAQRLNACEINSSFYREHLVSTYERWSRSVPDDFRFSLKLPKEITHVQKLADCAEALRSFLASIRPLSERGTTLLLVQLPPKLAFEPGTANCFFELFRGLYAGPLVCEPRHNSWFQPEVEQLWQDFQVVRAAADPAPAEGAQDPAGWRGLTYFRWHGSPNMYFSPYSTARLVSLAQRIGACSGDSFCIFDNTARGEATGNALELRELLEASSPARAPRSCRPLAD